MIKVRIKTCTVHYHLSPNSTSFFFFLELFLGQRKSKKEAPTIASQGRVTKARLTGLLQINKEDQYSALPSSTIPLTVSAADPSTMVITSTQSNTEATTSSVLKIDNKDQFSEPSSTTIPSLVSTAVIPDPGSDDIPHDTVEPVTVSKSYNHKGFSFTLHKAMKGGVRIRCSLHRRPCIRGN